MIHIYSKIIPPDNFWAITLWPFLVQRSGTSELRWVDYNHESIHGMQQMETTIVGAICAIIGGAFAPSILWILMPVLLYYFLYGLMSVEKFIKYWIKDGFKKTIQRMTYYYANPFEREAYDNEEDKEYLSKRIPFYSWRYIRS